MSILRGVNDILTRVKGLDAFLDENNNFEEIYQQGIDSSLPVNFKCDECGRKWTAILKSQVRKDGNGDYIAAGCPHYNTSKRKKSEVPLCSEVDAIFRFWDDNNSLDPATTRSNSNEKAHFICKNCGYDWTITIRAQGRGSGKCKCCEQYLVPRKGFSDVFTRVPKAKEFFDFNKNQDIDIYSISLSDSKTQIDWKCPNCDREWKSPLAYRIRKKEDGYHFMGCQDCYLNDKDRITPVASVPQLIKFWDFNKNKEKGLDPNLTSAHAHTTANWKCKKCGYEWETYISTRMASDGKCPYCEGKSKPVRTGINDVLTLCEGLGEIYDFEKNEKEGIDIYKESVYSKKRAYFKCKKCGHEWDSIIETRIKKNPDGTYTFADCPECSNKIHRQIPYSVEYPLLDQMYRYDLNDVHLDSIRGTKAVSQISYYWTCTVCKGTFDSTLESVLNSQKYNTKGCPYCGRARLRDGESFAELHPELMDEYAPTNTIDPYTVFPNNKEPVEWICSDCGYKWETSFMLRHRGTGNCPVCNRTVLIPDKNSFAAVYPDHVKYWADSNEQKPDEVFYNSSLWLRFICPTCKEEHGAYIEDFISGNSCSVCKGIKLSPKINSLNALYPDIARRWSPSNSFDPDTVFPTSWVWAKWICDTCSCEYNARIKDVVNGKDECPYCKGTRLSPETNSLKALYSDVARRWSQNNSFGPEMVLPTSWARVKWICDICTGEYSAAVKGVVNGTDQCPYCNGTKILSGFNSFADKHQDLLNEMDEIANYLLPKSPYDVSDKSNYKFWWICKRNPEHKYPMSPRNRLMFQKRHREPCLYCRGLRRKLNHFVLFDKKS